MNMKQNRIAVVGGGASGLLCSVLLKNKLPNAEIVLIEKFSKMGRKLLTTGNGKCNFSNLSCDGSKFNNPEFASKVLNQFTATETVELFKKLGIESYSDSENRVYPITKQASSVRDMLLNWSKHLGVVLVNGANVAKITRENGKFILEIDFESVNLKDGNPYSDLDKDGFDFVVIASGSVAGGEIYKKNDILGSFNLKTAFEVPSLVPVLTDKKEVKFLDGVRQEVKATLYCDGEKVTERTGEVLFRDYGLSGICIFELSHYISSLKKQGGKNFHISLDLMNEISSNELMGKLVERMNSVMGILSVSEFFIGLLNDRITKNLIYKLGIQEDSSLKLLGRLIPNVCDFIKNRRFEILGLKGFESAQVCCGGLALDEVHDTLEVKKVPKLFVCGEALDINGNCGGHNLQFAWSSAVVVAREIIKELI